MLKRHTGGIRPRETDWSASEKMADRRPRTPTRVTTRPAERSDTGTGYAYSSQADFPEVSLQEALRMYQQYVAKIPFVADRRPLG